MWLREAREGAGLAVADLAARVRVAPAVLEAVEAGTVVAEARLAWRLAEELSVNAYQVEELVWAPVIVDERVIAGLAREHEAEDLAALERPPRAAGRVRSGGSALQSFFVSPSTLTQGRFTARCSRPSAVHS